MSDEVVFDLMRRRSALRCLAACCLAACYAAGSGAKLGLRSIITHRVARLVRVAGRDQEEAALRQTRYKKAKSETSASYACEGVGGEAGWDKDASETGIEPEAQSAMDQQLARQSSAAEQPGRGKGVGIPQSPDHGADSAPGGGDDNRTRPSTRSLLRTASAEGRLHTPRQALVERLSTPASRPRRCPPA